MPKIRAMRVDTPAVATHLMRNPDPQISQIKFIAPFSFLTFEKKEFTSHIKSTIYLILSKYLNYTFRGTKNGN